MIDPLSIPYIPQAAQQLARRISLPRLVGSAAETQIGQELASTLEGYGYQVQAEPFRFADAQSRFLTMEIILCQALISTTTWLYAAHSPLQSQTAMLILVLLAATGILNRAVQRASLINEDKKTSTWERLCQRLGRVHQATNYLARLPAPEPDTAATHLILVAHYDSKSQRIPLAVRMTLFTLGIGGAVLFALLIMLNPLAPGLAGYAMVAGALALVSGIPLWFLGAGNESPGAIDNASGVGVVIELARALAQQPQIHQRLDLTILLTSAEELGTMGALAYVKRHDPELRTLVDSGDGFVLNLDGVGVDGNLRWVGKGETTAHLSSLVRQAGQELGIQIRPFNLPGALYDHLPFSAIGLESGTLIAVGRASLWVHTRRDTPDQLHLCGFDQAGQVVLKVIEALQR